MFIVRMIYERKIMWIADFGLGIAECGGTFEHAGILKSESQLPKSFFVPNMYKNRVFESVLSKTFQHSERRL
jgi:hypothetical protein